MEQLKSKILEKFGDFPNEVEVRRYIAKMYEDVGKAKYGLIDSGLFGVKIIAGIVTGIRFTETDPIYEISFDKNKWETSIITEDISDIIKFLKIAPLQRVRETHNLKVKF